MSDYICVNCMEHEHRCECRKVKHSYHMTLEELRRAFPVERTCCGTLPRSHHRSNCKKYQGSYRQPIEAGE